MGDWSGNSSLPLYYFIHYSFQESHYIIRNQVTDMYQMFCGAESFNQELCSWGQNHDVITNYTSMFGSSTCPHDPNTLSSNEGPWCHSYTATCTGSSDGLFAGGGGQCSVLWLCITAKQILISTGLQWTVGM